MEVQQEKEIKTRINRHYRKGLFSSFLWIMAASAIACGINHLHILNETTVIFIQLASLIPGATAIYGKKAIKEISTTGNDSPVETYNDKLFLNITSIGIFLAVWAFQLKS